MPCLEIVVPQSALEGWVQRVASELYVALCARAVRGLTALRQNEKIMVHNRACLEHLQTNHSSIDA